MRKVLHIARFEYRRTVKKKNFIISLLSVPIFIIFIFGLTFLIMSSENRKTPVGYVDKPGFLKDSIPAPQRSGSPNDPSTGDLVAFIPFSTEDDAQEALDSKTIQAYYVIKEDYRDSNDVEINKIRNISRENAFRTVSGSNLIVRWPKDSPGGFREFTEKNFFSNITPLFLTIVFFFLILMGAGYMMNAFFEEKENRTMEIIITSISHGELIRGKVLGILFLTLTQVAVWSAFVIFTLLAAKFLYGFESILDLMPAPIITLKMILLALPTYIMITALMVGVGSVATDHREAQQMTMLFLFPLMSSFWLASLIIKNPDSVLALFMSFFPLSAFSTMGFRLTLYPVPYWQLGTSFGILIISTLAAIWIAARLFRFGMLRYGKKLSLKQIFSRRFSHE
jgi:ABC-2 type transport system permease protein